jgi:hypothetical protein
MQRPSPASDWQRTRCPWSDRVCRTRAEEEALDISPRDVPFDDDDWVPTEPEFESDVGDELTNIAPLVTAKAQAGRSSGQSARKPTQRG